MPKPDPDQIISGPDDFAAAFNVSREAIASLATYERLLRRWQKTVNLVATSTLGSTWHRHFADSAQLVALAPAARTWVDLGSGAGFPGLVVAILLADKPGADAARVSLIESDTRKCAFLREVVRQTAISGRIAVDILSTRIENVATQASLPKPDVVMARALAPLDKLLALAAPLSPPPTVGLYLKGKDAAAEVDAARTAWTFEAELIPSLTELEARVVVVRQLEAKNEGKPP